ncbi:MAG: NAD(P)/FAD-dependent oxidoreductase [Promethearchaeota archaeon]
MKTTKDNIKQVLGDETVHLFFGIKNFIPIGYAWLFPKRETITVGWGNQINLVKNSRSEFSKFSPKLYEDNVIAVGDAAGIVDPISGKGIPYAMMSGQIAIESIIYCEKKEKLDKIGMQYERSLDKKFLRILKAKRITRDKIYQNDDSLKKFLSLWENHRSSEIVMRKLM